MGTSSTKVIRGAGLARWGRTPGSLLACGVLAASLVGAVLVGGNVAEAAPNYYSRDGAAEQDSKLVVVDPKAQTLAAGDKVLVAWRKSTPDAAVGVSLHEATAAGGRGKKVADMSASESARSRFTERAGAFYWTLPEALPAGRYVVQVKSGSFLASSEVITVTGPKGPELGPEKLDAAGVVREADVKDRGAQGHVVVRAGSADVRYEWGQNGCPALGGGLPGALAMMASVGGAEIQPRARELVQKDGTVTGRCIVGLIAKNRPAPEN
jgi:hypothetical protein